MQPTLVLTAPYAGIIYINGRFAGEVDGETPLLRPVGSRGAIYLEYLPFSEKCSAMARKLVFSGGEPMAESVEEADGLNVIIWRGGAVEIELSPLTPITPQRHFQFSGHNFTLDAGELRCDGRKLGTLPPNAQIPEFSAYPGGFALLGRCEQEQYLLSINEDFSQQTGFLRARQIELSADGSIRAVAARGDLVGHATLESWKLTAEGLMLLSSEPAWANGQPLWPATPEKTVRAMAEAALAELDDEAQGYLAPALRMQNIPARLREVCDLCVEMKYAPPDPRPCVGRLQLLGDRLARVYPLYFRATPSGGPQGAWQIEKLEWE